MSKKVVFESTATLIGKEYRAPGKEAWQDRNGKMQDPVKEAFFLYFLVGTKSKKCDLYTSEPQVVTAETTKKSYIRIKDSETLDCTVMQKGTKYYIVDAGDIELPKAADLSEENEFGDFDEE